MAYLIKEPKFLFKMFSKVLVWISNIAKRLVSLFNPLCSFHQKGVNSSHMYQAKNFTYLHLRYPLPYLAYDMPFHYLPSCSPKNYGIMVSKNVEKFTSYMST